MCANYRKYDQRQVYFTIIYPEHLKESNPLITAIDFFVDNYVAIERFDIKVRNDNGGAPAVHPKMMLKILFYSYANGIYSSREIERRLSWDLFYIYLACGQTVDHSTICDFILKYNKEIKEIFTCMVYMMAEFGYVTLDFVVVDGTKIKANVSKKFTGTIKDFKNKRKRILDKIEEIMNHTFSDNIDARYKQKQRLSNKLNSLTKEKERIDDFLRDVENDNDNDNDKNKNKNISTMQISITDRDARMVKDNDRKYMGYNCQIAVDSENHVIVASEVFNTASDRNLLPPMIESVNGNTNTENTEFGFDSGYFSSKNLMYIDDKNLDVYLPEGKGEGGKRKYKNKNKTFSSRDCKLQIDGDIKILTCPGGQSMRTTYAVKDRNNYYYRFYPVKEKCHSCHLKDKCYGKAKKKRFTVKKEYFDSLPLREKMTEKLSSKKGKLRMADRACIVEHVFGEIKELFKFRRFMHRTLEKVSVIWSLVCIGYNMRKLAKLGVK